MLIIKPSASILLLYENISSNSRAMSWTECLYFELASTCSCVQEVITGNSRARSMTECLYLCFVIHLFQKILIIMFGYQESFQKNSYFLGY